MFYLRLSVLLLPVLIFSSSEAIIFSPSVFFPMMAISSLALIYWSFWLFKKKAASHPGHWWDYAVLPVIFNVSSLFYFSLEPNWFTGQLVLLVNAFFLFNYLKNAYYLVAVAEARIDKLKNLSFFGGVLAVFFSASAAYGAKVFLGYSVWPVLAGLSVAILAAWYQIFIFASSAIRKNLSFFLIAFLILCEFAAVLFFLPFSYQLLGMIMTIVFYFVVGVGRLHLLGDIPKKQLRYYLVFSILATAILVLTARWL